MFEIILVLPEMKKKGSRSLSHVNECYYIPDYSCAALKKENILQDI